MQYMWLQLLPGRGGRILISIASEEEEEISMRKIKNLMHAVFEKMAGSVWRSWSIKSGNESKS